MLIRPAVREIWRDVGANAPATPKARVQSTARGITVILLVCCRLRRKVLPALERTSAATRGTVLVLELVLVLVAV